MMIKFSKNIPKEFQNFTRVCTTMYDMSNMFDSYPKTALLTMYDLNACEMTSFQNPDVQNNCIT